MIGHFFIEEKVNFSCLRLLTPIIKTSANKKIADNYFL